MTWCDTAEKDPIIATHAQVVDLAAQYMNILSDRKGDKGRGQYLVLLTSNWDTLTAAEKGEGGVD